MILNNKLCAILPACVDGQNAATIDAAKSLAKIRQPSAESQETAAREARGRIGAGLEARIRQAPGGTELIKRYNEASRKIQAKFDGAVQAIREKHDRSIKSCETRYEAADAKARKSQNPASPHDDEDKADA